MIADTPPQLLLIDDDQELTSLLQVYLQQSGFTVQVANDSQVGLSLATQAASFDMILLDVMMPGLDGFEVLKVLRQHQHTPVLMLTARGDDYDRIVGLELGADDYLPKPFNHRELVARIKAMLRRQHYNQHATTDTVITLATLRIDRSRQQVFYHDQPVLLTATEFDILFVLMAHAGQLVSKQALSLQALNKRWMAHDRAIDMHVSNVRKKLAHIAGNEIIKTLRGSGYLLVADA